MATTKKAVSEAHIIDRLVSWANRQPLVRAMLLTSSRANDRAPIDQLSDYDVILVVSEVRPYSRNESWLHDFGKVLVLFRDKGYMYGLRRYHRLALYEDGTKIDYTIWPLAVLRRILDEPRLPDVLDVGYRVLVDKDHLTDGLKAPTYTAHIPAKPTEKEYQALIEEFWWETSYVAKNLWRDELVHAKYNLDFVMKFELLRKLLEWRIELDSNWSWKPGNTGRGLKKMLPPELWSEFASTFVGADIDENWGALFKTTGLFRRVAVEVGDALGYSYPYELDERVTRYLQSVKDLESRYLDSYGD